MEKNSRMNIGCLKRKHEIAMSSSKLIQFSGKTANGAAEQPVPRKSFISYVCRDVFFYYTFLVLFIKSCFLAGFILNDTHHASNFSEAMNIARSLWYFYFGAIAWFLSFGFLSKGRSRLWYFWGINFIFSFIFLTDLWYLRGFSMVPSLLILQQMADLHNTGTTILSMGRWIDSLFFIDVLILLILIVKYREIYRHKQRKVVFFAVLLSAATIMLVFIPVRFYIFHIKDDKIQFYSIMEPNYTAYSISPIGYHLLDAYMVYKDSSPVTLSANEQKEIKEWFNTKKENMPDNKYEAMFKGKNLLMIQVESLERFVIRQKINGQEITPNLNKLIKNSLFFSNFHEQVNEGTTSDAELMSNTSVYPLRQGSTFFRYPYVQYNSLPILLRGLGYTSMATHADRASFWNWKTALTSIGYGKCYDKSYFTIDEEIGLGLSDGSFFRQSIPRVEKLEQPFLAYMITMTSHGPFNIPQKYRELSLPAELDKSTLGGYFQSIRYTDKQIGIFLDALQAKGILDNTVVVIYGDHEGPHKYYMDEIEKLHIRETWWMSNNKLDPLIIYSKGMQGDEINTIGGEIDILPTLCYLFGVDAVKYQNSGLGRNLLNTNKSFVVLQGSGYLSDKPNVKEEQHALKGLSIAQKIIQSNYFKTKNTH